MFTSKVSLWKPLWNARSGVWAVAIAATILFGAASPAHADPIVLYNTGDGSGPTDPNYKITMSPNVGAYNGSAYITTSRPGSYVTAPSGSQWISTSVDANTNVADGLYDYSTMFDLTGLDPKTATISGKFSADNGAVILLNGQPISGLETDPLIGNTDFTQLTAFTIPVGSPFISGINSLTFQVTNDPGPGYNPSALLVANMSGTADPIPEPTSLALFGMALAAGYCGWRRRKQAATA